MITVEFRHRPSYSTNLALYTVIMQDGDIMWTCSHSHSSQRSAERCSHKLLVEITPVEGLTRCHCGCKYWDELICHSCKEVYDPDTY